MKKLLAIAVMFCMLGGLVGCDNKGKTQTTTKTGENTTKTEDTKK